MVTLKDIDRSEIDFIQTLWHENLVFHLSHEIHFKGYFEQLNFDGRMSDFFSNPEKKHKITMILDESRAIGYCISQIENQNGEVCSLYVTEAFRHSGAGREVMLNHMEWFKSEGCEDVMLYASAFNEPAKTFYKQFGFESRLTLMSLKDSERERDQCICHI